MGADPGQRSRTLLAKLSLDAVLMPAVRAFHGSEPLLDVLEKYLSAARYWQQAVRLRQFLQAIFRGGRDNLIRARRNCGEARWSISTRGTLGGASGRYRSASC